MKTMILIILFLVSIIFVFLGLAYTINRLELIKSAKKREKLYREYTKSTQENKEIKIKEQTQLEEKNDSDVCEIKESRDDSINHEEGIEVQLAQSNETILVDVSESKEDKIEKLAESTVVKNENRKNKQDNKLRNIKKKSAIKQPQKAVRKEPENPGHRAGRAKKKKYALEMLKYYKINYTYAGESGKVVFVENKFKLNLETLEFMNLTTKYKEKGIKRLLYRLRIPGIEKSRGVGKNGK